jgi:hypothetical protein
MQMNYPLCRRTDRDGQARSHEAASQYRASSIVRSPPAWAIHRRRLEWRPTNRELCHRAPINQAFPVLRSHNEAISSRPQNHSVHPPSIMWVWRVVKPDSSDARYAASAAISSGRPNRPIGCLAIRSARAIEEHTNRPNVPCRFLNGFPVTHV